MQMRDSPWQIIQPEDAEEVKCKNKANCYCLLQLDICIRRVPEAAHNQIQIAMICEQQLYTVIATKINHSNIHQVKNICSSVLQL